MIDIFKESSCTKHQYFSPSPTAWYLCPFFPKTRGCYYGVSGPDSGGHMSKSRMCFRSSIRASSYTQGPTWGTSGTSWTSPWCHAPSPHSITPWRKLLSWSSVWSLWLTFSHPIRHKKLITCLRGGTSSSKQAKPLERTRRINKCSEFAFDRLIQSLTLSSSLEDQGQASPGPGRDMGTFEWPGDSGHRLL